MRDGGDVDFRVNLDELAVEISIRPPMGLEGSRVTGRLSLLAFLKTVATIQDGVNTAALQRVQAPAALNGDAKRIAQ